MKPMHKNSIDKLGGQKRRLLASKGSACDITT